MELKVYLKESSRKLSEVTITASESKGMTSASKIGQEAMQHLQPSSFADLLELLPGGATRDPVLTTPNSIRIREAAIPPISMYRVMPRVSSNKYATSSLGITFLLDNIPLNTDASMQFLSGAWEIKHISRNFINKGVDMRTLSTDDIDNVEIVRGIPSVEYSDLTSGLIKIHRKRDRDFSHARFKADMQSMLFYFGKGTNRLWRNFNLSGGLNFLSAKADPRNVRETYKRVTASLRGTKKWNFRLAEMSWLSNIDYTGSFDDEKVDPDLNYGNIDSYKSGYNNLMLGHTLEYMRKRKSFFSGFELDASVSMTKERTEVVKFMQLSINRPYTNATTEGEHDGLYYPYSYVGEHTVDGKPFYTHIKMKGISDFTIGKTKSNAIWGTIWNYSKNYGTGVIFDVNKPVFVNASTRPRAFNDIPAKNTLAFFIENKANIPISNHLLSIMTGISASSLIGLDKDYEMSRKFYFDPRVNIKFSPAKWDVKGNPFSVQLVAGIGSHNKFPTMIQLFPDKIYRDFVQLNYYHVNPDYRRVYIRSYILQPNNKQLKPARNIKYEFRGDMEYKKYQASVTYFKERMKTGFRPDDELVILPYKKYITENLDHANLKEKPDINTLLYEDWKKMNLLGNTTNGSETTKEGIEWVLSTPRYNSIRTRFSFSGAWFKTTYRNSLPQYHSPNVILDGKPLEFIGIYDDEEGLITHSINSDLRTDTYVPNLGLTVSLSFQGNWLASSQRLPISVYPEKYVDINGQAHTYTEADRKDKKLQWLKRNVTESMFEKYTVPFLMNVNLKATKHVFHEKVQIAFFVHRILDYSPDFVRKGFTVRRNQRSYFGMEINFKL